MMKSLNEVKAPVINSVLGRRVPSPTPEIAVLLTVLLPLAHTVREITSLLPCMLGVLSALALSRGVHWTKGAAGRTGTAKGLGSHPGCQRKCCANVVYFTPQAPQANPSDSTIFVTPYVQTKSKQAPY